MNASRSTTRDAERLDSEVAGSPRLSDTLACPPAAFDPAEVHHVGVFTGEGVGAEVVPVALSLLDMLGEASGRRIEIRHGGLIGAESKEKCGRCLPAEAVAFARDLFADGGSLFCGPGGDRFVYEVRREFDLYCKYTPIEPFAELGDAGPIRPNVAAAADMIAVRENMGGIYQGRWSDGIGSDGDRLASHEFSYSEAMIRRIMGVAIRLAASRRGQLHLVLKPAGIPTVSALWRDCAEEMARDAGVALAELEIDNAVFQLIANPGQFDVVVSPNMFGDVLADCAALLLASRGLSFSGNFNDAGNAAYQTGHGAARDIAGKDIANPIGQILSLGMMLRESFGWPEAHDVLRQAIRATLASGARTPDIAAPGTRTLGTREFALEIQRALGRILADATL